MLVVADVNISQDEVDFLRGIEAVERVVYVAQDLRRSMPDSEIVEYTLETMRSSLHATRGSITTRRSGSRTILRCSSSGTRTGW